jgi:hypothetical protein
MFKFWFNLLQLLFVLHLDETVDGLLHFAVHGVPAALRRELVIVNIARFLVVAELLLYLLVSFHLILPQQHLYLHHCFLSLLLYDARADCLLSLLARLQLLDESDTCVVDVVAQLHQLSEQVSKRIEVIF